MFHFSFHMAESVVSTMRGNRLCKYPEYCIQCNINQILFCNVCERRMEPANFYNRYIRGKQHNKLVKRNGLPPSLPLLEGDSNYYAVWPPVAIDCSSPIPERAHRRSANPSLDLVVTMDKWTKCNLCKDPILFNKFCWEVKPCAHKFHEECYQKINFLTHGKITCLYCLRHT